MVSPSQNRRDQYFMVQALSLAHQAGSQGEVPVGAIIVEGGTVIGRGMNACVRNHDPSAHAEILAMREAGQLLQSSRLDGASLYVTLEPCLMCCGALLQARISRLIFAAREPRTGGVVSIHDSLKIQGVDHHIAVTEGVYADESTVLLQRFFKKLR